MADWWCKASNRHDRRFEKIERVGPDLVKIWLKCAHDDHTDFSIVALPPWEEPEEPDEPDEPDEDLLDKVDREAPVRTDFLSMEMPVAPPWSGNYTEEREGVLYRWNTISQYPNLDPDERGALRAALKLRGHTHALLTAREQGDLGHRHDFYKKPEVLVAAMEEILEDDLQVLLFLSVDDDPKMAAMDDDKRIELFLDGLEVWAPYCSAVCPSIEWDEWGKKEALRATVKAIKRAHPDLPVGVHYLADWTENLPQWGWASLCREADILFYQQPWGKPVDPRKPHGKKRRRTVEEVEDHCRGIAGRCLDIGMKMNHFEFAQDGRAAEAVVRRLGDAGLRGMRRAGIRKEDLGWGQAVSKSWTRD